jgi:hypothetical protein
MDPERRSEQIERYTKAGIAAALVLIIFGIFLMLADVWPWVRAAAFILGMIILVGLVYFPMAYEAKLKEEQVTTPTTEKTTVLPVLNNPEAKATITVPPKPRVPPRLSGRPGSRLHELLRRQKVIRQVKVADEKTFLVIVLYTRIRLGLFRYKWDVERWQLELVDSPYVNKRLARRIPFFPVDSEQKILWLRRDHWWSHAPVQLLIIAIGLGVLDLLTLIHVPLPNLAMAWLVAGWCLLCIVVYYALWMRWGYHYLVMTDVKLRYPYTPPFFARLNMPEVNLDQLKGGVNYDQTPLGRILGFGSLKSDTPGSNQKVEGWLGNLRYIPYCEAFARILNQARDDLMRE